jgi:hypothetical protein
MAVARMEVWIASKRMSKYPLGRRSDKGIYNAMGGEWVAKENIFVIK